MVTILACVSMSTQVFKNFPDGKAYSASEITRENTTFIFSNLRSRRVTVKDGVGEETSEVVFRSRDSVTLITRIITTKIYEIDLKNKRFHLVQSGVYPDGTHSVVLLEGKCN